MTSSPERYPLTTIPGYYARRPGIQVATKLPADATEDDFRFVQQLGVEWVMVDVNAPGQHTAEHYAALREKVESWRLQIYRLANHRCHNMQEVTLNLPGRDAKIHEYLDYIRNLGKAGIHYSTYAHMGNGIWSSGRKAIRGGATARSFHLQEGPVGHWAGERFSGALTHGRRYSEEELWDNYATFIRQVVPVAEEAGVYIGIHPDDPPVYDLGGIPRCIFGSFEGYRRAIEIADSPNVGVCLCVGCWLEGGAMMGRNVLDTIRYFGAQHKLFKVHFRNVTAPMPAGFDETFLDDGYMDMYQVMRVLREVGYDGAVMSDHLEEMVGGARAAEGFAIGYIRALVQAANDEFAAH